MALCIAKDSAGILWCYKGNTPPTRDESTGEFTDNEKGSALIAHEDIY